MIVLRNKLFARRDYAGLSKKAAEALREHRKKLAENLYKEYRANGRSYEGSMKSVKEATANAEKMPERIKKILKGGIEAQRKTATDIYEIANRNSLDFAHNESNKFREFVKDIK